MGFVHCALIYCQPLQGDAAVWMTAINVKVKNAFSPVGYKHSMYENTCNTHLMFMM